MRNHSDGKRYYDHVTIENKTPAGLIESNPENSESPTHPFTGADKTIPQQKPNLQTPSQNTRSQTRLRTGLKLALGEDLSLPRSGVGVNTDANTHSHAERGNEITVDKVGLNSEPTLQTKAKSAPVVEQAKPQAAPDSSIRFALRPDKTTDKTSVIEAKTVKAIAQRLVPQARSRTRWLDAAIP